MELLNYQIREKPLIYFGFFFSFEYTVASPWGPLSVLVNTSIQLSLSGIRALVLLYLSACFALRL